MDSEVRQLVPNLFLFLPSSIAVIGTALFATGIVDGDFRPDRRDTAVLAPSAEMKVASDCEVVLYFICLIKSCTLT